MGAIRLAIGGGINPTEDVIPVRRDGHFQDSIIHDEGTRAYTKYADTLVGWLLDFGNGRYYLGDTGGFQNSTFLVVDDENQQLELSGVTMPATAGAASGKFIVLKVNGVNYKLSLLNF